MPRGRKAGEKCGFESAPQRKSTSICGFWIDEAVGNFNLHDYYAPGRGGWSWYDNLSGMVLTDSTSTALGDTIRMSVGYDVDGDNGYAESMLGCRYLGGSAVADSAGEVV